MLLVSEIKGYKRNIVCNSPLKRYVKFDWDISIVHPRTDGKKDQVSCREAEKFKNHKKSRFEDFFVHEKLNSFTLREKKE